MDQRAFEVDAGPVPRDEYERRHAELQRKYETFSRRVFRALAAFAVGLLLTAGAAAWQIGENSKQAGEIRQSLVTSCKVSGNPLREASSKFGEVLSGQLQDQVDQQVAFEKSGLYAKIFPYFDQDELHELIAKGNEEKLEDKAEIDEAVAELTPVDCEAKYQR